MCPIGAVLCQWNFLDDHNIIKYASDTDTYIRKNAYLAIGNIYVKNIDLREKVIITLNFFLCDKNEKVRQTIVYSLGEIGKTDFNAICDLLSKAIHDPHPSVRNAVVGSLKKTGQRNPAQTIKFAEKYLHHDDPKIRREIIHGIELRGRTHPEDILPLLCEVQNDHDKDIKKIIIHVLGQISYKKGCLEKVISHLKTWPNKEIVRTALDEIIKVHYRYKNFSHYSPEFVKNYLQQENIYFN